MVLAVGGVALGAGPSYAMTISMVKDWFRALGLFWPREYVRLRVQGWSRTGSGLWVFLV